jgi:Skp family chaperone for outer membrane proteins
MRTTASIVAASLLSSALTAILVAGLEPSAPALAPLPTDLGPADALVLAGKSELRITNEAGRVAWGSDPSSRAFSIGTVHVGRILGALLESETFAREREEFAAEGKSKREAFDERYKALVEKARSTDKDSPEFPAVREEFEAFQREIAEWSRVTEEEGQKLIARHHETAYAQIREAVEVVAEKRHIDLVMRFVPPADPMQPGDVNELAQQLQARTFLRTPESIDLTEDILSEMNIKAPAKD